MSFRFWPQISSRESATRERQQQAKRERQRRERSPQTASRNETSNQRTFGTNVLQNNLLVFDELQRDIQVLNLLNLQLQIRSAFWNDRLSREHFEQLVQMVTITQIRLQILDFHIPL
jgi:hypothetical protein